MLLASDDMFWQALNLSNFAYQSGETACSHAPHVSLVDISLEGSRDGLPVISTPSPPSKTRKADVHSNGLFCSPNPRQNMDLLTN